MPTFRRLSADELSRLRARRSPGPVDLTDYTDFLRTLAVGEQAELTLAEGEIERTVKRRLTMAAHRLTMTVQWQRTEGGTLRFVVMQSAG